MLWSYEKPTEPGWYMVNNGDTVDKYHLGFQYFLSIDGNLFDHDDFHDPKITARPISEWNNSIKFLPIDYDYLNNIGNE